MQKLDDLDVGSLTKQHAMILLGIGRLSKPTMIELFAGGVSRPYLSENGAME